MFNTKRNLAHINALLDMNDEALARVAKKQREADGIAERRWTHITGEINKLHDTTKPQTIELSHVDAPNVKVEVKLATVVQALADHLNLGMVPEQDAEIVVINAYEP
jgi:hypothetical protein